MSNKITNPFLKQLISGISQNANQGRVTDITWNKIHESKNFLKKEADEKKPADTEDAGLPPLDGKEDAASAEKSAPAEAPAKDTPADAKVDPLAGMGAEDAAGEEEVDKAKEDATKAKADLEKAKAEKDQAEKEIKKHSYVKLGSGAGTQFLLGKLLDHAFKTNTIDALAGEMVQKLKITTPEDITAFSEETAAYRVIPGFPELLSSMKTMATKQSETPEA